MITFCFSMRCFILMAKQEEKSNSNFGYLAIIAIVAIVAVSALVGGSTTVSPTLSSLDENLVGDALKRTGVRTYMTGERYCLYSGPHGLVEGPAPGPGSFPDNCPEEWEGARAVGIGSLDEEYVRFQAERGLVGMDKDRSDSRDSDVVDSDGRYVRVQADRELTYR